MPHDQYRIDMFRRRRRMFHHHQGKNLQASTRMPVASERHLYLQGVSSAGDSGLVLSTDAKPRLKWTPDWDDDKLQPQENKCPGQTEHTTTFKTLQSVLEKAQETLGGQNMGTIGLEAAKVQLSDLASKVSTQCLNSAFPGMVQISDLPLHQKHTTQPADCLSNQVVGLNPLSFRQPIESKENDYNELRWRDQIKDRKEFFDNYSETNSSNLSIGIGVGVGNNESDYLINVEKKKTSPEMNLPFFSTKLDLNTDDENDPASSCKDLDLNCFSWS